MELERAPDGRVTRVLDRDGHAHAELTWIDDTARVTVALTPDFVDAVVIEPAAADPLFGRGHPMVRVGERGRRAHLTTCSPIDWRAPRRIPAIAAPHALPPGAGSVVLDVIALLAADAGVSALRYAGPYPTDALWRALGASFRTDGDRAAFSRDAADRAIRLARDEIAIDFAPAPFERAWIAGGEVHVRDGVQRVRIDGALYARGGSPGRVVADGAHVAAELWFGDAAWARVAVLAADGRVVDGPHAVPACTSSVIGARFPPALRVALGELVADLIAPALADAARAVLADDEVVWADCGAVAARAAGGRLEVHAALWDRLAAHGMARVAGALAEALAPVVALRAQARLAAAIAHD